MESVNRLKMNNPKGVLNARLINLRNRLNRSLCSAKCH